MTEYKQVIVKDTPKVRTSSDWLTLALAILGAVKLVLAAPPFEIIIADETIDAYANLIAIAFTIVGIWQNTYVSKKAQRQKDVLIQTGLKDK